ncbi:MAG TPA: ABC transporter permease, partial [Acidimicrobiia bacterium]|nr:ABC transporter permease [Acidimicrobiia bacterium]
MGDQEHDGRPDPEGHPAGRDVARRVSGIDEKLGRAILTPLLALVLALAVGAVIIMVTDVDAWRLMGEDLGAALSEMLEGVWIAYRELFRGAFGSVRAISETLFTASPLILAGLAVAVGFRTGLFNIGARGQMFAGGLFALWVGLHVELPALIHIPVALIAAVIGGGLWGGLAGFLKARFGAHEVITTIMLNFVAAFFVLYILKTSLFQEAGSNLPQSAPVLDSARLPPIFAQQYRVNISLIIAVLAVWFIHWLLFRSTIGFEFRAAGLSSSASAYAGMNVSFLYTA